MEWTFVSWVLLIGIVGLLWVIVLAVVDKPAAWLPVVSVHVSMSPDAHRAPILGRFPFARLLRWWSKVCVTPPPFRG
jgi:hypothetical protein